MDEKVIGLLAAAVGVAPTEAAELIKSDEGISELTDKHTAKLADLRKDADGRALRIVTQAFKSAGVEGEVFEQGRAFKENVTAAVEALKSTAAEKAAGETEAPAVADLKRKLNEATANTERLVQAAREEERKGFAKERAEFDGKQLAARKATLADGYVGELNPVFGLATAPAAVLAGRRADLIEALSLLPTVEVNGELFEADGTGEIKRDASGNPIRYAESVRRETAKRYDLPVSNPKDSPGNTSPAGGDASYSGPTSQAEYESKLNLTQPGSTERVKLMEDWKGYKEKHQPAA